MKEILSKKSQNRLKCICGLCKHTYSNKSCIYNKIIDSNCPELKMYQEINKLFKEENKNVDRRQRKQSKSK
jgi:hypothetical protein